jgi:hypothetical protein
LFINAAVDSSLKPVVFDVVPDVHWQVEQKLAEGFHLSLQDPQESTAIDWSNHPAELTRLDNEISPKSPRLQDVLKLQSHQQESSSVDWSKVPQTITRSDTVQEPELN